MTTILNTWTTKRVCVQEINFDGDLHQFSIANLDGVPLGVITPADVDDQFTIIDELNLGRCPIEEAWVDGDGHTYTMNGWGGLIGGGDHVEVEGLKGTWYVIDQSIFDGKRIYLLEHEQFGEDAACLIVDQDLTVLAKDVYNGFEDLENWRPANL